MRSTRTNRLLNLAATVTRAKWAVLVRRQLLILCDGPRRGTNRVGRQPGRPSTTPPLFPSQLRRRITVNKRTGSPAGAVKAAVDRCTNTPLWYRYRLSIDACGRSKRIVCGRMHSIKAGWTSKALAAGGVHWKQVLRRQLLNKRRHLRKESRTFNQWVSEEESITCSFITLIVTKIVYTLLGTNCCSPATVFIYLFIYETRMKSYLIVVWKPACKLTLTYICLKVATTLPELQSNIHPLNYDITAYRTMPFAADWLYSSIGIWISRNSKITNEKVSALLTQYCYMWFESKRTNLTELICQKKQRNSKTRRPSL